MRNIQYTDANGIVTHFTHEEYKAFQDLEKAKKEEARKAFYAARKAIEADCTYCQTTPGGPGHFASTSCQSGAHAHCSCSSCF